MKSYYDLLDVDKNADAQQLKRAYYKQVRQYTPERFPEEFKKIHEAYETLADDEKRKKYDSMEALPEDAIFLLRQAREAEREQRIDDAISTYRVMLKKYPGLHEAGTELAKILQNMGKTGTSIKIWEELYELAPDNAEYSFGLAEAYYERSWRKKAITQFNRTIKLDSSIAGAWEGLLRCHTDADEMNKAEEVCNRALEVFKEVNEGNIRLYLAIAMQSLSLRDRKTEGYLCDIVQAMKSSREAAKQIDQSDIEMLLFDASVANYPEIMKYILEAAALLTSKDDEFKEHLEKANLAMDIKKITDEGFTNLIHDLLVVRFKECDCKKCKDALMGMEYELLCEIDTNRPLLIRLKKEFPHLYKLHAEFFEEVLYTSDPKKMMYRRSKTILKSTPVQEGYQDEPLRRAEPKVGRNEPCPCGSGKKYKRCCGA